MDFSRRKFLQIGAATGAAVALSGEKLHAMELNPGGKSVGKKGGVRKAIPYTCMTCNIEDGGIAYVEDGKVVKLEGNPKHPGNRGRLCAKGNAGWQHIYDSERILFPLKRAGKRGEGKWKRISWDEALNEVSGKIRDHIKSGKPRNEICLKWGRNRTHGFIDRWMNALGSASTMNHTSVCESSKKIGMEPTWGPDIETPDFANTKYIINFGSNILEAAYFHNPYAQRIMDGVVGNKAKLVTFDVRLSNTAAKSDEWHPIFPGTDGVVALAMAHVIMNEGLYNEEFIKDWVNVTADELKKHLAEYTPQMAENYSGVKAADIIRIAKEFATAKPATTYTYRGPAKHLYGSYNERSCMLLPIITGNIEIKGGYCLPRGGGWDSVEPVPPKPKEHSPIHHPHNYPLAGHHVSHHIPFQILEGEQKVAIWMDYYDNPAYAFPSAHVWRKIYQDEKLIPYFVTFSPVLSETSQYADIILPDVSYLERHDPENMPSDLLPWIGLRQPVIKPIGESKEFRDTILELARRIDPDGSLGIKKYFDYGTTEDYMHKHFDNVKGLKEAGGWEYLKKNGVFPDYGELNPNDYKYYKDGKLVEPEYGLHMKEDPNGVEVKGKKRAGFGTGSKKIHVKVDEWAKHGFNPMPTYKPHPWHWKDGAKQLKPGQMILTTFKWNVHTQARTANLPLLGEIVHKNPAWINTKTAAKLGIKHNDLIRITSGVGHMVTRANVTESIHPEVVAISTGVGHDKVCGRFASANKKAKSHQWAGDDAEHKHMWWDDHGVHPNDIIPVCTDPIGGSQGWYDGVVTVEKAKAGDKYGDVVADVDKAIKFYHETLTYNVAGVNHKKMHPEVAQNAEPGKIEVAGLNKEYKEFNPVIV